MTYRKVPLISGEFFHIYNRGNSKQKIFLNDEDRARFVKLLYLCNSEKSINFRDDIVERKIEAFDFERGESLVSIGAWVLMPNHFHIYLISTPIPGIGGTEEQEDRIALFVRKLCVGYANYFNKKYQRTGALFEGRFRSTHIGNDNQAKYLFSYIHLNPVKLIDPKWKENKILDRKKMLNFLNTYRWSSYNDHRGILRQENKILDLKNFPKYFSNKKELESEIFSWIKYER